MRRLSDDFLGLVLVVAGLIASFLLVPDLIPSTGPALLRVLFGWGAIAVVIGLILGGVALSFAAKMGWQVRWRAVAYGELLLLTILALVGLLPARPYLAAAAGDGGGIIGWAIDEFLRRLLPEPAVWSVLMVGLVLSVALLWRALPPPWTAWTGPIVPALARAVRRIRDGGRRVWQRLRTTLTPDRIKYLLTFAVDVFRSLRPSPIALEADKEPSPAAEKPTARPAKQRRRSKTPPEKPGESQNQSKRAKRAPQRAQRRKARAATLPPLDLLHADTGHSADNADVRERAQILKNTLDEFGVPVEVVSIKQGPTVTQFGLEPGEIVRELRSGEIRRRRISVRHISRLSNDLALALAASPIRIEAPVPGRPYVGIEVPNTVKSLVSLRDVLESKEYAKIGSALTTSLGRDVSGDPIAVDLSELPHLLIAGATGSGKSVCINAIVCSLLMNNGPETLRLMMVDPKMVELPSYNGIPHLLGDVITDPSQVTGALAWLTLQMDDRYRSFADRGVRNIAELNRKAAKSRSLDPLPYLVLVIDELADLMMMAADDIERQVCRLAQMSRATGIHLVLATQRPSVDVITGLIKANFPARIAFAVTSQTDSRVILDTPGAEKLLGRGDMLYMSPDSAKLARIQGCFVSDQEIDAIVDFWRTSRSEEETGHPNIAPWIGLLAEMEETHDDLLEQALDLLRTKSNASTSWLQRQLRIGFPRAARLMEQLEEMGAVGPDEGGGRSRQVWLQPDTDDEPDA